MRGHSTVLAAITLVASLIPGAGSARAELHWNRIHNFEVLSSPEASGPSVLRLYIMRTAPIKLDWSSPRRLLETTVAATALVASHAIGHVEIEVQYRNQDDPEHHIFTGATDIEANTARDFLLKDQIGFSILERGWPGALETEAAHAKSMIDKTRYQGRVSVVTFLISDASCLRLLDYYRALLADPAPRHYGFAARPLRSEGSGCSAFGASFVQQIGLLSPDLKAAWTHAVRIPLSLMAGHLGRARISVAEALVARAASRWATAAEPHMYLEFFDPDRMADWVDSVHAAPDGTGWLPVERDLASLSQLDVRYDLHGQAEKNVRAIVVDARDVPTPTGPVFTGPPALRPMSDTRYPSAVRSDTVFLANGSFEIRP